MEELPYKDKIRIGTSGFQFDDWKGIVYPQDIKKTDMLSYYEKNLGFNALEVNFTYYTLPHIKSLIGMSQKVSKDFLFFVKAYKGMTHEIKDKETNEFLDNRDIFEKFLYSIRPLTDNGQLGGVLAQFPYYFYYNNENIKYIKYFKDLMGDIKVIVEFRNIYWHKESVLDFLKENNLSYCIVDEPRLKGLMPFNPVMTSQIGYFRFHGRNKNWFKVPAEVRYDYYYSDDELKEFLKPIRSIATQSEATAIFFNNCHAGSAAKNAIRLLRLLLNIDREDRVNSE